MNHHAAVWVFAALVWPAYLAASTFSDIGEALVSLLGGDE